MTCENCELQHREDSAALEPELASMQNQLDASQETITQLKNMLNEAHTAYGQLCHLEAAWTRRAIALASWAAKLQQEAGAGISVNDILDHANQLVENETEFELWRTLLEK